MSNNHFQDYNNRWQGSLQKRSANSRRYTVPKIQRVNHLNILPDELLHDKEAEQAEDSFENDELFLGQNPCFL